LRFREVTRPLKQKTAIERKAVYGRGRLDRALPLSAYGVSWRARTRKCPMADKAANTPRLIGSPAFHAWRRNFGWA